MQRTWVALHRRSEAELPVQTCFDSFLRALLDRPLGSGISVPETVVFAHMEHRHYYFDTATGLLACRPSTATTSRAVVATFLEAAAAASPAPSAARDDDTTIVAVWFSEKKEARGVLLTAEYFTAAALEAFFERGERRKLGVLQRFIYPRLRRATDNVNSEFVVHWSANGDLAVQRCYTPTSRVLDADRLGATARAVVLPVVQVQGKVAALTLPFGPGDLAPPRVEAVEAPTFLLHARALCQRIQSYIEEFGGGKFAVRALVAALKFSRHDEQLYLCGLWALRLSRGSSFELVRVPRAGEERHRLEAVAGELDVVPLSHTAFRTFVPQPMRLARSQRPNRSHSRSSRSDSGKDDSDDEGDKGGNAESLALGNVSHLFPTAPPGHFECPNCGAAAAPEELVRVPYRRIVEHTERASNATRRHIKAAAHHTAALAAAPPAAPRCDDAPFHPSAATARRHGDGPLRSVPRDVAAWAEVPPVLRRLNLPLDEVATRRVWATRSALICRSCALYFGWCGQPVSGSDEGASPGEAGAKAKETGGRCARGQLRQGVARPQSARAPDAADDIATTELQLRHRAMRRAERSKAEARAQIDAARRGEGALVHAARQDAEVEALLAALDAGTAAVGAAAGVAPSAVLMCDLHCAVESALNTRLDGETALLLRPPQPSPSGGPLPRGLGLRLPPPPVAVDTSLGSSTELRRRREAEERLRHGRRAAHTTLARCSLTFAELPEDERRHLIEIVGADTANASDDDDGAEFDLRAGGNC